MQITNLTLAYHIVALRKEIANSIVRKVQQLENGWLKFRLQTKKGGKDLIITPQILYVAKQSMPAKQLTSGYGALLRKQLQNKKIMDIRQHELDRVAIIEFDSFYLILELFAKGNVILADKDFAIISAYRKEHWKDRTLRKGLQYKFPSSKGKNPAKITVAELEALLHKSKTSVIIALVAGLNIAPVIAEEACYLSKIDKSTPGKKAGKAQVQRLCKNIKQLYSISQKKLCPALVELEKEQLLLPIKLRSIAGKPREFPSLNDAIDSSFSPLFLGREESSKKQQLSKAEGKILYTLREQEKALQNFKQIAERNRSKAELLYKNYTLIKGIMDLVQRERQRGTAEKDIMYKLKKYPQIKSVDLKRHRLLLELE